ncbi:hypothetical protein [Caldovatus aquaticus]|uniref:Uncharacterized protein n=1 Tax=Caldovatus aquaticus TaxID=2865671 RepID=A0ABS7F2J9_9PROT|nr:hypothetical protein [Caldovatus aquaticus]MBW8269838.1 hypothetical protein [Caldovatus aquaticus]
MFGQAQTIRISGIAALAFGIAAATLATARAQAPEAGFRGPERGAAGNIVGGGVATIHGGGDEMVILYSATGAGAGAELAQPGRVAHLTGGAGDGPEVVYLRPETVRLGREAWVTGGGDEMQVVYTSPYATPAR